MANFFSKKMFFLLLLFFLIAISVSVDAISVGVYTLTVDAGAGGTATGSGSGSGTVRDIVAYPDDGYSFSHWNVSGNCILAANLPSTSVTVNGNCTVTANFRPNAASGYFSLADLGSGILQFLQSLIQSIQR